MGVKTPPVPKDAKVTGKAVSLFYCYFERHLFKSHVMSVQSLQNIPNLPNFMKKVNLALIHDNQKRSL